MKSSRGEEGERSERIHQKKKPRHIGPMEGHLIAAVGEFVGTFFFLWMAYSAQLMVINQASSASLIGGASSHTVVYISLIYGLSLLVNAWAFYRISGGLFNPAVSMIPISLVTMILFGRDPYTDYAFRWHWALVFLGNCHGYEVRSLSRHNSSHVCAQAG